jgi:hypothetical protein
MRPSRGCTEPPERGFSVRLDQDVVLGGASTYRYEYAYCPVNYVTHEHRTIIGLLSLFKQGKMLESGGVGDQDAKYLDIMIFLEGLWNQAEIASMEKVRNK